MTDFIPVYEPTLQGNELKYVTDAVKSTWISSLGKYISLFESGFSRYIGCKLGVSVCNGTVALHLVLKAMGIGKGDEVIVPDLTFVATANVAAYAGAKPVFVDADKEIWCIDVSKIEEKITKKTKAIIPVHLYGHPCDMDEVMRIAEKHGLKVIEDCAEAHGAEYKGKKVGSIGHAGCFSFYGNKPITTGEGGMIVTNEPKLAERMRFLKDHAMDYNKRYYHPEIGFNYRMTNVQAAIGLAQLETLPDVVEKKRNIARQYNEMLKGVKGITLPPEKEWAKSIYWMYSLLIEDNFGMTRDEMIKKLEEKGIGARPFFIPMHMLPPYKSSGKEYKVAEELSKKGINLPSSAHLGEEQIKMICDEIKQLAKP